MEDDFIAFTSVTQTSRRHSSDGLSSSSTLSIDGGNNQQQVLPALITDVPAPWLQYASPPLPTSSPFVRLHNEILTFCDYITPTRSEHAARDQIYAEIVAIVKKQWPAGDVVVFGSQMTRILTPSSDIDLVVHTGVPVASSSSSSSSSSSIRSSFVFQAEDYAERCNQIEALRIIHSAIDAGK